MNTVGAYVKCDVCGKPFVCYTGTWRFKRIVQRHTKYFCSYSCYKCTEPKSKRGKDV